MNSSLVKLGSATIEGMGIEEETAAENPVPAEDGLVEAEEGMPEGRVAPQVRLLPIDQEEFPYGNAENFPKAFGVTVDPPEDVIVQNPEP